MEKNKEFSQQQIVDCDWIDSQCNGGLMEYAYTYIQKTGGIESYEDYPYVGQVQTCKADKSKYDPDVLIARLDEEEMKEFYMKKDLLELFLIQFFLGNILEELLMLMIGNVTLVELIMFLLW